MVWLIVVAVAFFLVTAVVTVGVCVLSSRHGRMEGWQEEVVQDEEDDPLPTGRPLLDMGKGRSG